MQEKKFHWVNEDVVIDFRVHTVIKNVMAKLEELDLQENWGYDEWVDALDAYSKAHVIGGDMTIEQRNKLLQRYPMIPDDY